MHVPTECPTMGAPTEGDATLQAVLSFLDDHDTSLGGTSGESTGAASPSCSFDSLEDSSDGAPSPTAVSSTTAKKVSTQHDTMQTGARQKRTPMRSDKRQREEMLALREESLALQDRLNELKSQLIYSMNGERPQKKRMVGAAGETVEDSEADRKEQLRKLQAEAWQVITEAQQKRRLAAEEERDRLKELVHQQKKSFRQLRRFLVRHAEKHKDFEEHIPKSLLDGDDDAAVDEASAETDDRDFEELSRMLPTMVLQTGGLFKDQRLDELITTLRDVKIQNEESHKMTIEALESSVVPFDVATTAEAVWQHHLTKAHCRVNEPDNKETLEISETRIRRIYRTAIEVHGTITKARGRMETRRYVEPNRVVIVQSSINDRIEHSSMQVPNFAIRHFQWTVIGPPRNAMLRNSGKAISQVEIYGVNVPTMTDFIMSEIAYREAIKRGCVEAVGLQLEFERQSVENILMQKLIEGTNVDRKLFSSPEW